MTLDSTSLLPISTAMTSVFFLVKAMAHSPQQPRYLAGWSPNSIAAGDFNNDTRLDIVVANYEGDDAQYSFR